MKKLMLLSMCVIALLCLGVAAAATETEAAYLTLQQDTQVQMQLDKDLYVDLNGYDLTGTIQTNGYRVYGMDSTTDSYTCDAIGYFNCTDENGAVVVPAAHFKSDITGSVKRYMTVEDQQGYSFHRFYVAVTHQSLKPATAAVGYRAVVCGDEMVLSNIADRKLSGGTVWRNGS